VAGVVGVSTPVLELIANIEIVASSAAFDTRFATYANLPAGSTTMFSGWTPVATVAGVVGTRPPVQESMVNIETEFAAKPSNT
jgi:hypothetical protein